jgi:hypothetical protein
VAATKGGLQVIEPALLVGRSGVPHRFDFLASDGSRSFAFDFYKEVGGIEVLRSYIKEFDTDTIVQMVCLKGKPSIEGERLAREYGMRILYPESLDGLFERQLVETRIEQEPVRFALTE